MADFNAQIIEEFRENDGHVATMGFGDRLVVLHSTGARSGEPRVNPIMALPEGDGWVVAASMAGAPQHPAWYHNLVAHPEATIEVKTGDGIETVDVAAVDLEGSARDEQWARFLAESPGFGEYETKAAPRVIPVVRLDRR